MPHLHAHCMQLVPAMAQRVHHWWKVWGPILHRPAFKGSRWRRQKSNILTSRTKSMEDLAIYKLGSYFATYIL